MEYMKTTTTKVLMALCVLPVFAVMITQQITHFKSSDLIVIIINLTIALLVENIIRQNERKQKLLIFETQFAAQQAHIRLLTENQMQIRTMSHDFRQQVQELYTLCTNKQYGELQIKLSELSERQNVNPLADTGYIMLDSILTSKIELSEKHKIDFKLILDIQNGLDYIGSKICVLIGNALDNAIEACIRADEDGFIGMELIATQKQFLCGIKNTVGGTPQPEGEILKTSKDGKLYHGIGMQSMRNICAELNGTITFDYDEKYFNTRIQINFRAE